MRRSRDSIVGRFEGVWRYCAARLIFHLMHSIFSVKSIPPASSARSCGGRQGQIVAETGAGCGADRHHRGQRSRCIERRQSLWFYFSTAQGASFRSVGHGGFQQSGETIGWLSAAEASFHSSWYGAAKRKWLCSGQTPDYHRATFQASVARDLERSSTSRSERSTRVVPAHRGSNVQGSLCLAPLGPSAATFPTRESRSD